ncbi:MAG: hypothetical protein A2268_13535 [Candidatus Raymondbacteria bacterium RifOxyA12_full_50_37]|uniref:Secretion system C-terminal sorting domain-containing protein n=1 Tax=Candidatus Raymondbacteria bacterium RIFOXYD12_FULL_49_13 TaxID=1817890 RepID=A0A1F7F8W4_UNCRA|nr:MAG: hypothetical protein A2268_13535 [Candidatus Raymondbacteria bacterium RifOxyA12_full_50_37]OGJ91509.1 MAG: hypothetical protein A2248_03660 [Candidatus Raymondbacteria bacterium RIFOXYA2_FULL_49_16]OGJ97823.1 MAG: hypothetical protein A2453_14045 [Candidatus Raymondbacteria bacterium RIFOXYC2_FULL_50_21]OGK02982.1 MAG: hypothetical protein A2519_06460 [Candidatus Raymondbacteria bacterium RIFOXYD12_FULL_49_13]OGP43775.1 MAG: hypothetical protein A2324_15625 [Candidatus Raymondbacteria 
MMSVLASLCFAGTSYLITSDAAAHGITRGHNRKLAYHPGQNRYFVFVLVWTATGGKYQYTSSTDLINWTPLQDIFTSYLSAGSSSMDLRFIGDSLFYSQTVKASSDSPAVFELHTGILKLESNGSLTQVEDNRVCSPYTIYYGSLHRDSYNHFWYFGRYTVNVSNEYTTPVVMRNSFPLNVKDWDTTQIQQLAPSKIGKTSTAHWGFSLSNGRMLSMTSIEKEVSTSGGTFLYCNYYDGAAWQAPFQVGGEMPNDAPDDLRPGICMDENKNVHVLFVPLVGNPNTHPNVNRNLRHIKISPPYTSSNMVTVKSTVLNQNQDIISVQVKADRRPGMEDKLYCTFIAYDGSDINASSLYLTRFDGVNWEGTQTLLCASAGNGWSDQSNPNAENVDSALLVAETKGNYADVRIFNYGDLMFPIPDTKGISISNKKEKTVEIIVSPNPFNPKTTIEIRGLESAGNLMISIYDIKGTLVKTLVSCFGTPASDRPSRDGQNTTGAIRYAWDAGSLQTGLYIIKAKAGDKTMTRKITLLK